MRILLSAHPIRMTLLPIFVVVIVIGGCSRSKYRIAADREAYHTIAERNGDPRWQARDVNVGMDPRSRYFDAYNPDCAPMPKDDPTAHRYMRQVNGMEGWEHWYDNGIRSEIENANWEESLPDYVDLNETGAVKLDIESALRLAYLHSPNHQSQLETLYLSALDVTRERFRLDTQYFGGYDLDYDHSGARNGVESNRLSLGRPAAGNPALQLSRRFATAGQLLVGFANSFVFEFSGTNANVASSLLNFSFLQPLLRGGGRDIALEQLTFLERVLLANLRSYTQFRQGFYTLVAIGDQGVSGPQRGGAGTSVDVFSGQGFLSGYVGLLQQMQQIRNSEDNLSLQQRTLNQLKAYNEAGLIDLVQVDQFDQNVESEKSNLLQSYNRYYQSLDQFKVNTLGLPPDLQVDLDDSLIRQFQLVDRQATGVQDMIAELQDRVGVLPKDASVQSIKEIQTDSFQVIVPLQIQLAAAEADLKKTKLSIPIRERTMTAEDKEEFSADIASLEKAILDLRKQLALIESGVERLQSGLTLDLQPIDPEPDADLKLDGAPGAQAAAEGDDTPDANAADDDKGFVEETIEKKELTPEEVAIRDTVILLRRMLRLAQGSILIQARGRLEAVSVESIDLDSHDAYQIALHNRLDFMNARASLVDDWRQIQVAADALQSVLNVSASGDVRTAGNNPLKFRGATSNVNLGLQFDAPLTRVVERNTYRESLINYQRSRRNFIRSRDSLHLGLRVLLRDIEQLRTNLEIQRRSVAIAIRRVDLTRAALEAPVAPPQPGQRAAGFGPTAAINLLSAQSALRDTQNAFLTAWLNYYAAKMRLARELGVMQLDFDGRWIETPPPGSQDGTGLPADGESAATNDGELQALPPPVEAALLNAVDSLPDGFTFDAPDIAGSNDHAGLIE